jgi:hypothetical protein
MRNQLSLGLFVVALVVSACGGSSGDFWNVGASPQSANLSSTGSGTAAADGRTITLVGGDSGTAGCAGAQYGFNTSPCTVVATVNDIHITYSFDWSYSTKDSSGPAADLFGMIVDGKVVNLSDQGGAVSQSGHVEVKPGETLSFFVNCTDCTGGAATATVTNFQPK